MNETIKNYQEITVEEAGEMLRESGWKPVGGVAFKIALDCEHWSGENGAKLTGVLTGVKGMAHFPFQVNGHLNCRMCAKVTELDPCQAPDGCPELEPWMAYVGSGDQLKEWEDFKFLLNCGYHWGICSHSAPAFPDGQHQWAIDVRTEWAQEHFPEHCRIRNYQEPDAMEEAVEKFHRQFHTERDDSAFRTGWRAAQAHQQANA